jgi:hypothetical protein
MSPCLLSGIYFLLMKKIVSVVVVRCTISLLKDFVHTSVFGVLHEVAILTKVARLVFKDGKG